MGLRQQGLKLKDCMGVRFWGITYTYGITVFGFHSLLGFGGLQGFGLGW